jgi:hypothetical protein
MIFHWRPIALSRGVNGQPGEREKSELRLEGKRTGAWVRAKPLFSVGVSEEYVVWNQVTWGLCVQLSGVRCNEC